LRFVACEGISESEGRWVRILVVKVKNAICGTRLNAGVFFVVIAE